MGSFMSGRGTANLLTRTTAILAAIFFTLSLTLALLNRGTTGVGRLDPGYQRRTLTPAAPIGTAPAPIAPPASGPVPSAAGNVGAQPAARQRSFRSNQLTGGRRMRATRTTGFPSPESAAYKGAHDAVRLHHRRRGVLPGQGHRLRGARRAAAGARLHRAAAQARPLSQRRSGHDEPVPARRGVRHRRRRRDRPGPRPLRALHRRARHAGRQRHHRAHLLRGDRARSGAATTSAPPSR